MAAMYCLWLAFVVLFATRARSASFMVSNNCNYTVWPGLSSYGTAPLETTGFALNKGDSRTVSVPASSNGRLWGRTHCSTNSSTGNFSCLTGDCSTGTVECSGSAAALVATLFEFALDSSGGQDFYDVSLVDGFNVPMLVAPQSNCTTIGCAVDLNALCPNELVVASSESGGEAIACKSACVAFRSPQYCCSGAYGSPSKCRSVYSQLFKNACPRAYSYAIDDATSTFTCNTGANYVITFCPSTRSEHSQCLDSSNGLGYICNCSAGYQGDPYLPGGCQDINECDFPEKYPCHGICTNTPGNYSCLCPPGKNGQTVTPETCYHHGWGGGKTIIIGTCVAIGILLLLLTSAFLWKMLKQRSVRRRKDKFYRQNRGLLLQQLISSDEALVERLKIFDLEELEKATNNFDSSRVVGGGGHGTVYKGILSDQRVVAIKKSKIVVQSEIDQFINEVVILSQINHRNVVKLFGCCLESQVPLLVYEFISGGTLFNLLHSVDKITAISLDDRLRIAREIVGALAYLHSAASISVFHRDVKSSNVLINENYTAKVSDFGASRSLPLNQTRVTTAVQGTFGYLDPEYFQTGQLTEKSDVYSFGVILVELLTRQLPVLRGRLEELEGNLSKRFIDSFRKGCLFQILDPQVLAEGSKEEIEEIALLADTCLRLKGEERPTMKEVERRLDSMRNFGKQKYDPGALLRHGSRTDMQRDASIEDNATTSSTRQYSLQQEFLLTLELPR